LQRMLALVLCLAVLWPATMLAQPDDLARALLTSDDIGPGFTGGQPTSRTVGGRDLLSVEFQTADAQSTVRQGIVRASMAEDIATMQTDGVILDAVEGPPVGDRAWWLTGEGSNEHGNPVEVWMLVFFRDGITVWLVAGGPPGAFSQAHLARYGEVVASRLAPAPSAPVPRQPALEVVQYARYPNSIMGGGTLVGIVQNSGETDVNLDIAAEFRNEAGTVVGVSPAIWRRPVVPAGEYSPFLISLDEQEMKAATVNFSISATPTSTFNYWDARVVTRDTAVVAGIVGPRVTGSVVNVGSRPATASVLVAAYSASGAVLDVRSGEPSSRVLGPGSSAAFAIDLGTRQPIARVEAWAYGYTER
jgi:hypothetical protein